MAKRYNQGEFYVNARKRKTAKVSNKYKITQAEERRLMNDVGKNSAAHEWGYSPRWIDAAIDRHKKGNAAMKRVIEEQLTDVNYHHEAELLSQGKYKQLIKENKQYHKEYGSKPTAQYSGMYAVNG